jgi:hypothetical protein
LVAPGKAFVLHLQARLEKRDLASANSMTSFFDLARREHKKIAAQMRGSAGFSGNRPANMLKWLDSSPGH